MRTAIIGGGAAGFFAAIALKEICPSVRVTIYERSKKCLAKVEISGGGRCNCTNSFAEVGDLKSVYPRGHKLMKRLFNVFDHEDAYAWFERHGVPLTTQDDQCVFPVSQDSHSITLTLQNEARRLGVEVRTLHELTGLTPPAEEKGAYTLEFLGRPSETAEVVILTAGGQPRADGLLDVLSRLGLPIQSPHPSLFTFTIAHKSLTDLMGVVVEGASVALAGTKFRAQGPLLITHWGMSGPAILKLSSHAALHLADADYRSDLLVNWTGDGTPESVLADLLTLAGTHPQRQVTSVRLAGLQSRLWDYLVARSGISLERRWAEVGKKGLNKLVNTLTADVYPIAGRYPHREEFVTAGGVALSAVNPNTLEAKALPGLYFAGELLDIDAVTGGFNLQAAWTTGFVAGQAAAHHFA
ncbi:MAG: aminoacetone oxidase family FAD-binding enzyme [Bacteroidaceae bacterium]|nr:aminoacetone oxidase family FAD-binding enzyme [Bacteroidaceae bacterium]